LSDAALTIAMDRDWRERMLTDLVVLKERTLGGAAKNAARAVWSQILGSTAEAGLPLRSALVIRKRPRPSLVEMTKAIGIGLVSLVWSLLNSITRIYANFRGLRVKLGTRVVGIGNIQAGGAGKTPLAAAIANEAAERGLNVCILTRGYRSRWEREGGLLIPGQVLSPPVAVDDCGDEAMLLHQMAPKAWIAVGADRAAQFVRATEKCSAPFDLVLLDDGFQSRQIDRDLDIVAMTSHRWWRVPHRDFPFSLKRENLKVWTKGEVRPQGWSPSPDVRVCFSTEMLAKKNQGRSFWLVTGIADPEGALERLRAEGWIIRKQIVRPDHARYERDWIERTIADAETAGCVILTTGKDWVKWAALGIDPMRVVVVEPELVFLSGRETWERVLWGRAP
ncbi:MAG: tetraacyldisaccharide 4'-kinase, partial [Bdellovibrionota bacterium]